MGFWDVTKSKALEFSKVAAQKTNNMIEKARYSISLTECQDKLKELYASIGEQIFIANETQSELPDFNAVFEEIRQYKEKEEQLRTEIEQLKN